MRQSKRLIPTFNYPLPRFQEQYAQAVKLALVAEKMKDYGVRVDTQRALTHAREGDERAAVFTQMFLELTGLKRAALGEKGEGGTKAVKDWFREVGAPDVVFDKVTKKAKFDAAALTCWSSDFVGKPFAAPAAALLGLKKSKTCARFARAYYDVAMHEGGRLHFDFNTIGTKGTRWSASAKFKWVENGETVNIRLNAQNVPSKKSSYDFGKHGVHKLMVSLRDCFVPDAGCVWAKFDYEGAEAALIAYYTQDDLLLEWLHSGADIHTENAKVMFLEDKIPADLRKLEKGHPLYSRREVAKPALYALTYQAPRAKGDDKYPELWKQWKQMLPNLSETYFKVCTDRFFAAHQGIRLWQETIAEQIERDGCLVLPQTGRTIYLSNTARGRNMGLNYFMQSGIGWAINDAVPHVAERCDWAPSGLALLLQVHDELDLQIPPGRLDEICEFASGALSKAEAGLFAAPDVGDSWGTTAPRKST